MSRKPSPNSLQGFIRTDASGHKDTTNDPEVAKAVFGLTDVQIALAKAGDTITLKSGRTVCFRK